MSVYVVDASVAAKWFFDEPLAEDARRVLRRGNRLYAPDFFLLEMDNILCKRIRRGELTLRDAEDARVMLRELPIERPPFGSVQNRAFEIANQTQRSLYDCLYLALSVLLDGRMVTADRKLYDAMASGPFSQHVAWVEDVR